MVAEPQNVAVNGDSWPKKRLVLNAFVEMCMFSIKIQPSQDLQSLTTFQAPATKVLVSGNTPTIVLQTSTRSSIGSTWLSN